MLDDWQAFVLTGASNRRADGKFAALEVGLNVARQNGKGEIEIARELLGLYKWREELIIHSAHQFDTSMEAFDRLHDVIDSNPALKSEVKSVSRAHGAEGIRLKSGPRIRFRTRTKSGGRGFSCVCLVLDEAMILPESFHGALFPMLSAKSQEGNPQVWYAGSAVDQIVHEYGVVFARIRERGHTGTDPSLAYFEWSADWPSLDEIEDPLDPERVAQANPGLGIRISFEHVTHEQRTMGAREFAVERLGVGDWPRTDGLGQAVIDYESWKALTDEKSTASGPLFFAWDVSPDRLRSSISVASRIAADSYHVELVERRPGTGWIAARIAELDEKYHPDGVLCDGVGPAASLIHEIEALGVNVEALDTQNYAQACASMFDCVERRTLRHLGQPELAAAIRGAVKRPLGDAWAWSRKNSSIDITPLVSCTLALWGAVQYQGGGIAF